MKRMTLLLPLAAAALIAAGCGSDEKSASASTTTAVAKPSNESMKHEDAMKSGAAMTTNGTRLKVVDSQFGRVVADSKGEALYLFDREGGPKSECYGACAAAWPPVLTKGKPTAGGGVKQSLLGTTKRNNGKLQVTYAGQPLYYYVSDSPGTILCHDVDEFGGTWLVIKPSGAPA